MVFYFEYNGSTIYAIHHLIKTLIFDFGIIFELNFLGQKKIYLKYIFMQQKDIDSIFMSFY